YMICRERKQARKVTRAVPVPTKYWEVTMGNSAITCRLALNARNATGVPPSLPNLRIMRYK
ncbi:hypothetical protein BS50DRAFT_480257, partial [Corynespora cassiicola Philippines]